MGRAGGGGRGEGRGGGGGGGGGGRVEPSVLSWCVIITIYIVTLVLGATGPTCNFLQSYLEASVYIHRIHKYLIIIIIYASFSVSYRACELEDGEM